MTCLYFCLSLGVCATLTVLKPTSTPSVLLMGNLMIMRVRSKKRRVRNRRKLKSCRWVDVKVMFMLKIISKNVFSLCVEMKSEDNFLLGSCFISERQFWFIMDTRVYCSIRVDYKSLRTTVPIFFYIMGLYLHNAMNTKSNIWKITDILFAEEKKKVKVILAKNLRIY